LLSHATLHRYRPDDKLLVLKRIQTGGCDTAERDAAEREVNILKNLRFPNVIGYADSFSEGLDGADALCVVMEYAEEGTLEDVLNARKASNGSGAMPELEAMDAFVQILEVRDVCRHTQTAHAHECIVVCFGFGQMGTSHTHTHTHNL
jgi:serine/threonine protein kinase